MIGKNIGKSDRVLHRKVIRQHDSLYVCLPKCFVERHNIRPGDFMSLISGTILRVMPMQDEQLCKDSLQ